MKTKSDFKRAMQLDTEWYRKHVQDEAFKKVKVGKLGSDYVVFIDEQGKRSRLDFPPADDIDITIDGQVNIYWPATYRYDGIDKIDIPRRLILTYKKA